MCATVLASHCHSDDDDICRIDHHVSTGCCTMGSCITKRSKRNSFYGSIEDSQETTNASASSAHLFDYEFTQSGSGDNIKSDEFQHEIDKWLMEAENIFLNVVDIV